MIHFSDFNAADDTLLRKQMTAHINISPLEIGNVVFKVINHTPGSKVQRFDFRNSKSEVYLDL